MQTGEDRRALTLAGAGVQVRATGADGAERFHGHAAMFDVQADIGDPLTWGFIEEIAPGCFSETVREDDQRFLLDHATYYVVSRCSADTLTLAQDGHGLAVDSALDPALSYVNDLKANVRNRNITGMSFGFYTVADEWRTERVTRGGRTHDVQVRRMTAARVPEVSAVTFPAYETSDAGMRAEDPVRAVGLALRSRPDAAAQFERRARHCPDLGRYFEREQIAVRPEVRKAVGSHSTGTDEGSWDGPAQEKKLTDLDQAKGRKMYAWQDPGGDAAAKSAWKFPHHFVDADGAPGAASTKACENGISVLNGGRGGSGIPDDDRQGVYNHLAKHLRDAGKDPAPLDDHARAAGPLTELRTRGQQHGVDGARTGWYRFERRDDSGGDTTSGTEVFLYDIIGGFWGQTTEDFVRDLAAIDTDTITVRINSPGGDVFDGIAIMNALRGHSAHITTMIEGLAASAASFIAMAGDDIVIWRNAEMMIHDPWSIAIGSADDFRDLAERLDRISDNIASAYADRAGGDVADWREAMRAETWYSAEEAVEAGLADSVRSPAASETDPDERSFDRVGFTYADRAAAGPPAARTRSHEPDFAQRAAARSKALSVITAPARTPTSS